MGQSVVFFCEVVRGLVIVLSSAGIKVEAELVVQFVEDALRCRPLVGLARKH